jgi:hypothetical protein
MIASSGMKVELVVSIHCSGEVGLTMLPYPGHDVPVTFLEVDGTSCRELKSLPMLGKVGQ